MAATDTEAHIERFKTQSSGRSNTYVHAVAEPTFSGIVFPRAVISAFKNYRVNRENGAFQHNLRPFPDGGLSNLDIDDVSDDGWSDRGEISWYGTCRDDIHWWRIVCKDGRIVTDFGCEFDRVRGWPDSSGRYWYIIHGPNGIKMEQFFQEQDPSGKWRVKYNENGDIAAWMKQKDIRYLLDIARGEQEQGFPETMNVLKEVFFHQLETIFTYGELVNKRMPGNILHVWMSRTTPFVSEESTTSMRARASITAIISKIKHGSFYIGVNEHNGINFDINLHSEKDFNRNFDVILTCTIAHIDDQGLSFNIAPGFSWHNTDDVSDLAIHQQIIMTEIEYITLTIQQYFNMQYRDESIVPPSSRANASRATTWATYFQQGPQQGESSSGPIATNRGPT